MEPYTDKGNRHPQRRLERGIVAAMAHLLWFWFSTAADATPTLCAYVHG